ncbi:ubiquitin C-terminal hydrolase Ubp9 [Schizosaccharomyces pombe]|uniref:Probable ubiquitin carboxyl-terminal hydrolase 9 n=1 Tax=Schizosaccharomyces pombe (strain 972 / ATCC 24843) TaxID=284812 RepID=UBP9_SCHPO|nr:ubiquitin hydrolase Ubp9 [Schizosaccharomyces pombe]Q9P7V9.1 RecName: Full=Probable ubiquitin carboxyl-terminal hydrolase 9; AltName: Full=Deubiquitinating enzyme 9; AltName: Full=Ubiquitin thioesterase 9; AltName: Full=Ubiquitin-specific-processing protease 9 [Schizosaccharomyces pombe 972h-]CAB66456.1 ubiquitin C-terminal hydrolase Ubp9 [Schizosaccharomyces pombe]|eukprot:NP_596207.1 ubiquitin hydrolase Ubp9 [Schizosaccharomyces pombe]
MSLLRWMGMNSPGSTDRRKSTWEAELPKPSIRPETLTDRFYGLTNYGNTCYVSSVLVSLYHLKPFRDSLNSYPLPSAPPNFKSVCTKTNHPESSSSRHSKKKSMENRKSSLYGSNGINSCGCVDISNVGSESGTKHQIVVGESNCSAYGMKENIYTCLKDLYCSVSCCDCRYGICSPERFIQVLRRDNEAFRSTQQQDAHEFFNFLLNSVTETLDEYYGNHSDVMHPKWVHSLFEGTLTSETKCLTCENITSRDESFLDLSIDIENHTSVTSCLRSFSASEMLSSKNKFHCDVCKSLQEAEKRMKIKKLPKILSLHLKRFKYNETQEGHDKLFYTIVFTNEMRLFTTTEDAENAERMYYLSSVIVHVGGGPHRGHYVSIVRTKTYGWVLFDDENVTPVNENYLQRFFGDQPGQATAYVLFYTAADEEDDDVSEVDTKESIKPMSIPSQLKQESVEVSNLSSTPRSNSTITYPDMDPMVASFSSQYSHKTLDRDINSRSYFDREPSLDAERFHSRSVDASPKAVRRESRSFFPSLTRKRSKFFGSSQSNSPKDSPLRDTHKSSDEHSESKHSHTLPWQFSRSRSKR